MDAETHDECQELARLHLVQNNRCGSTPLGYDVQVYCERPPGHDGRHWCDSLNWPA